MTWFLRLQVVYFGYELLINGLIPTFEALFVGDPAYNDGPYLGLKAALFRPGLHFRTLVDLPLADLPGLLPPGPERRGGPRVAAADERVGTPAREEVESSRAHNCQKHPCENVIATSHRIRFPGEQLPIR